MGRAAGRVQIGALPAQALGIPSFFAYGEGGEGIGARSLPSVCGDTPKVLYENYSSLNKESTLPTLPGHRKPRITNDFVG